MVLKILVCFFLSWYLVMVPLSRQKHKICRDLFWKFGALSLEPVYLVSIEWATSIAKYRLNGKTVPMWGILWKHLWITVSFPTVCLVNCVNCIGFRNSVLVKGTFVSSRAAWLNHSLFSAHQSLGQVGMEMRLFLYSRLSLFSRTRVKVTVERTQTEIWDLPWLLSQGHRTLHFSRLQMTYLSAGGFEVHNV